MIVILFVIGLLLGALVHQLADYLPRFAAEPVTTPTRPSRALFVAPYIAVLALLREPREWKALQKQSPWLWLNCVAEVASGVVLAVLWTQVGMSSTLAFYGSCYFFFLITAIIDVKYRLVLNVLTYPAIAIVLAVQLVVLREHTLNVLLGGFMAFGIFFLTARIRPGDLGWGDVKLATLLGFAFGFPQILWALIIGAGAGGIVVVVMLINGQSRKATIPYAPFLCLGAIVALFYHPFLIGA